MNMNSVSLPRLLCLLALPTAVLLHSCAQSRLAAKEVKTAQAPKEESVPKISISDVAPTTESIGDSTPITTIVFDQDVFDFGKIKSGEVVKHEFTFTNTGKHPVVIENVKPACGCTAIEYSEEPVPPGEKGKIKAQFDSAGKSGPQMKHITIIYNGDPKIIRVTFSGEVLVDSETPAQH
jgi:hypothetical protein